jgi:hypothetical protein
VPVLTTVAQEIAEVVERGWPVIPVGPDKKSLVNWRGYQKAPASLDQLHEWANTLRPSAWAVVTGRTGGAFVLDFDGEEGRRLAQAFDLNRVAQVYTPSGGLHLYVSTDGVGFRVPSRTKVLPGMDVRGERGYALFHGWAKGGNYIWIDETIEPVTWGMLPIEFLEVLDPALSAHHDRPQGVVVQGTLTGHCASVTALLRMALERAWDGYGRNNAGFDLAV